MSYCSIDETQFKCLYCWHNISTKCDMKIHLATSGIFFNESAVDQTNFKHGMVITWINNIVQKNFVTIATCLEEIFSLNYMQRIYYRLTFQKIIIIGIFPRLLLLFLFSFSSVLTVMLTQIELVPYNHAVPTHLIDDQSQTHCFLAWTWCVLLLHEVKQDYFIHIYHAQLEYQ